MTVRLKRAYLPPAPEDGFRVLVDRLWPRGLTKTEAALDLWLKDAAPSAELRRWFGHDPGRWTEFCGRYEAELTKKRDILRQLIDIAHGRTITLVYGARDEYHNHALVLRDALTNAISEHPQK
jgi:uncharacterized protein YeaO (DUF488 family)